MSVKRQTSDQTIIHHLAGDADDSKKARVEDEETNDELQDAFDQLQQAIDDPHETPAHDQHVVHAESVSGDGSESKTDDDSASDYERGDESLLSEESHDMAIPESVSGITDESQYEDEDSNIHDENSSINGDSRRRSHDEHTEALIQSAARAIVASIEKGQNYQEGSVLSTHTDDSYNGQDGTEITYDDGTDLTSGTESTLEAVESEVEEQEKENNTAHVSERSQSEHSSSDSGSGGLPEHEDDVFSQDHESSPRSSINSCDDPHTGEHSFPATEEGKVTQQRTNADIEDHEDFGSEDMEPPMQPISRIPSNYSTLAPHHSLSSPAQENEPQYNKVISHPPFRSPSSVRAIQMASPTPSNLGSPRSSKPFKPTVSRLGTPTSQSPKKSSRQPKFKKEYPLILLHVTVLPLRWQYESIMEIGDALPEELRKVRDNWRLLQDHSGNTVLERGVLLPHPQDSYEALEERLLDALELPIGPHARILKCGHYMESPSDAESSDEENPDTWDTIKSCNVCGRIVRYDEILCSEKVDQRFRVKVYASNGLMRAGAWAAAWKEMERIDVEIEPFVPRHLIDTLEDLFIQQDAGELPLSPSRQMGSRAQIRSPAPDHEMMRGVEEQERRRQEDEQRLREIYGHEAEQKIATSRPQSRANPSPRPVSRATGTPVPRHSRLSTARSSDFYREREFSPRSEPPLSPEPYKHEQIPAHTAEYPVEDAFIQSEKLTESRPHSRFSRPQSRTGRTSRHADASLLQLLLAAVMVFLKDKRNVAILLLSALVLLLAVRPNSRHSDLGIAEVVEESVQMVVETRSDDEDFVDIDTSETGEVFGETSNIVVDVKEETSLPGIDYAEIRKIIEEGLRPVIEMSKQKPESKEFTGDLDQNNVTEMADIAVEEEMVDEMVTGVEKTVTEFVSEDFIRKIVEEQLRIVLGGIAGTDKEDESRELGSTEAVEEMEVEVMV